MVAVRHRQHGGFTLVEALASIVVLAIIGAVMSPVLLSATDGYLAASTHGQLHLDLSVALDRINRELRRIPPDTAAATARSPHIDSISQSAIAWRNASDEVCSLALQGTDLTLAIDGGPAAILLRDVTQFTLAAFDDDNAAVTLPAADAACDPIRRVACTITVTRGGSSDTLRSRIFLRNTMSTTP